MTENRNDLFREKLGFSRLLAVVECEIVDTFVM